MNTTQYITLVSCIELDFNIHGVIEFVLESVVVLQQMYCNCWMKSFVSNCVLLFKKISLNLHVLFEQCAFKTYLLSCSKISILSLVKLLFLLGKKCQSRWRFWWIAVVLVPIKTSFWIVFHLLQWAITRPGCSRRQLWLQLHWTATGIY